MISFLIPFWSQEPHRLASVNYVHKRLQAAFPEDEVLCGVGGRPGEFSRAATRNYLASVARGDILIFVDADSVVPEVQIKVGAQWVGNGDNQWVLPYSKYYNLTEKASKGYVERKPGEHFEIEYEHVFPSPEDPVGQPAAVGGMVIVDRPAFEAVNGYDERFEGWGEEDRAFAMALAILTTPMERVPGALFHLWHPTPDSERFGQPYFEANRALGNRYREAFETVDVEAMHALVFER